MLNRIVALIIMACFALFTQAQTVITSSDFAVVGDTLYSHKDTMPTNFSVGNAGANQNWDFSGLNNHQDVTTYVVDPATTAYASDFPNANLAVTNDNQSYLYLRNTGTVYDLQGIAGPLDQLGNVSLPFSNPSDQYHFDIEYQGTFSGNAAASKTVPFDDLPQSIQDDIEANLIPGVSEVLEVRLKINSSYTDEIDGSGTATTPIGTYDCLRRKRIENSTTIIEANVQIGIPPFATTSWEEVANIPSNTTEYQWLAKETKQPLVTLEYDTLRNIIGVTYAKRPPYPVANFGTSGSSSSFTFTDSSSYPETWLWDFGDGNTSTMQNPSHNYSNGNYTVCLTVTNESGMDSTCQSLDVNILGVSAINQLKISSFPNPTSENILISWEQGNKVDQVSIVDLSGKSLKDQLVDGNSATLNISYLADGIYMALLQDKAGTILGSAKIIKSSK